MSQDAPLQQKLKPPPLFENPDFLNSAPIRLRPVDLAQLLGVSRARISQLTKAGRIKPFSDGSFCPSAVARELIRTESPKAARSKFIVAIREELQDARTRTKEALAARDQVARQYAELLEAFRDLADRWLRAEIWLEKFNAELESSCVHGTVDTARLESAWDIAAAAALTQDLPTLIKSQDPEGLELIAAFDPSGPLGQAILRRHDPPPPLTREERCVEEYEDIMKELGV